MLDKTKFIPHWLCVDCMIVEVNDDSTGIDDDDREREVRRSIAAMRKNGQLLPDWDSNDPNDDGEREFSWQLCDCCCSGLGGARFRFQFHPEQRAA